LRADRVEIQHRLGQRAVEIEDHRSRRRPVLHSAAASGAPPVRATSSFLILPTSIPLTRLVIDGSSSSIGGGSPLLQRRGLLRATTRSRGSGLLRPRSLRFATASVTASSYASSRAARARRAVIAFSSLPGSQRSALRRIAW